MLCFGVSFRLLNGDNSHDNRCAHFLRSDLSTILADPVDPTLDI